MNKRFASIFIDLIIIVVGVVLGFYSLVLMVGPITANLTVFLSLWVFLPVFSYWLRTDRPLSWYGVDTLRNLRSVSLAGASVISFAIAVASYTDSGMGPLIRDLDAVDQILFPRPWYLRVGIGILNVIIFICIFLIPIYTWIAGTTAIEKKEMQDDIEKRRKWDTSR